MSKLISIRFYSQIFNARRDKQVLIEKGIHGFIANENLIQFNPGLSQAVGGIQLQVFDVDVKDALKALESFDDSDTDFISKDKKLVCQKCGSDHIFQIEKLGLASGWYIWGFQVYLHKDTYYCCYCDGEFSC